MEKLITANPSMTFEEAQIALKSFISAEQGATVASKALGMAINTLTTMAISFAITELINLFMQLAQATDEVRKKAQSLGEHFKTDKSDILSYKEAITDLYKTINDSNSSYEDSKKAREQLMSIQDELISKYGSEKESIDFITQAINGQVQALEELAKKKWTQTLNDFNKTKFTDNFRNFSYGVKNNADFMLEELEKINDYTFQLSGKNIEQNREFFEKIKSLYGGDFNPGKLSFTISGSVNEVYDKILAIQRLTEKYDISNLVNNELTTYANYLSDIKSQYDDFYSEYVFNERILGTDYEQYYAGMRNAYENYRKSRIDNQTADAEEFKQAFLNSYQEALKQVQSADSENGVEISVSEQSIINSLKSMYPDIQNELNMWDLQLEVGADFSGLKDDFNKFNSVEDLMRLDSENVYKNSSVEQQLAYDKINALADKYNVTVNQIAQSMRDLGQVTTNTLQTADTYFDRLGKDILSKFTDEELEILMEAKVDKGSSEQDLQQLLKELQGQAEIELDVKTKNISTLSDIQKLSDGLGQLQKIYQDVANGEEFDFSSLLNNENFSNAFKDLGEAYTDFVNTVTSNSDDINACQYAFDNLADAYIRNSEYLKQVTLDTKEATIAQLEQQGIANARILVLEALANAGYQLSAAEQQELAAAQSAAQAEHELAYAEAERWAQTRGGVDVANENIQALYEEAQEAGVTKAGFLDLISTMIAFNNTGLDVSGKIAQLSELARVAGATASAVSGILGGGSVTSGQAQMYRYYKGHFGEERANKYLLDLYKSATKTTAAVNGVTASIKNLDKTAKKAGGGGGGGGGAKKAADETKNAMQELSSSLDEVQSAYQNLMEIQDAYNENGFITVDQMQQLMQMDLRYLAMLDTESGGLSVNEQAFRNLTQAKLEEMQVALARQALDLINSFTSEAAAVEYLAGAYGNLAGNALNAAEAALQAAAALKMGQGGAIAQAAGMVMQGYNNAKAMMGHVNLDPKAGKKSNSSADKNTANQKDPQREAYEAAVKEAEEELQIKWHDWIERLIENLSDKVEHWQKSIDKLFSYWNKTWAINKTIVANREEIAAQQRAYYVYQEQASKAAKMAGREVVRDDENMTFQIIGDYDLGREYINKIAQGSWNIEDISDNALNSKIDAYIEWLNHSHLVEKSA